MKALGSPISNKSAQIYAAFKPVEGQNTVYYGRIRNGKTYAATADILELLERGEIVYANWPINFEGFDQRSDIKAVIVKFLFGKDIFYKFEKTNFKYIDTNDPNLVTTLNRLVGVHIFIDEGQWIFNSHLKTDDVDKRRLVLEGGHYCRSLNVITQRPSNILKDIRSQVNIWYKCEKVFHLGKFIRFVRYEIQDMKDDLPDEDPEKKVPEKAYWASSRVYNAYQTHGRRSADSIEELPAMAAYSLNPLQKLIALFYILTNRQLEADQALTGQPTPVLDNKKRLLSKV